ncbi:hypothetical protein WOLCODRAFT_95538 [Wolfiporia cocos MD-104 SS10]|uniref:RING-type domain-containing protein n=1 Tax=Wolfiporia cocos (strain MD-104) TaxID=742152 RepID=A0A2H3JNP9_WOLCO|nr:hypothetical protein WOLCODRAFT_95538 [Wolfiporia cocos MD-104 SS10]
MDLNSTDALAQAAEPPLPLSNASLRMLASRLLSLPSRVVARIRSIDDLLDGPAAAPPPMPSQSAPVSAGYAHMRGDAGSPMDLAMSPLPGPLAFVTSWYFFGLLFMALLLNRIHNIVVPPRVPPAVRMQMHLHAATNRQRGRLASIRTLLPLLLPVDISSPRMRVLFRAPSLYLLGKALAMWLVLLLQTSDLFPGWKWGWLQELGEWVAGKSTEEICWFTFTSTCIALAVGAIMNGLEGVQLNHNAPFNLFAFSFQLHIYASSTTHTSKFPGAPSRPSNHVIVTILVPLLQVTLLHALELLPPRRRNRLYPTAFCSLLTLAHFHALVWTRPHAYPLTNFFPCVTESTLLAVILLSLGLGALTQLLTEGRVRRWLPAGGGGGDGRDAWAVWGEWDREDWGVVLARMGTAEVRAQAQRADLWADTLVDWARLGELGRFARAAWAAGRRAGAGLWGVVRGVWKGRWMEGRAAQPAETDVTLGMDEGEESGGEEEQGEEEAYGRFLRGEALSDDEDEEFGAVDASPSDEDEDGTDEDGGEDAAALYADFTRDAPPVSAPVLLAHITHTSDAPLTRRRYRRLAQRADEGADEEESWAALVAERRVAKMDAGGEEDAGRRNCVICATEPRDVICWPCRCLALCNDCRETLASRSHPSMHTCPCCRRTIDGYSRIYIP